MCTAGSVCITKAETRELRNELIRRALKVTRPEGHLFFSCNYFGWHAWDLQKAVEYQAKELGIRLEIKQTSDCPLDFQLDEHPCYAVLFKRLD